MSVSFFFFSGWSRAAPERQEVYFPPEPEVQLSLEDDDDSSPSGVGY